MSIVATATFTPGGSPRQVLEIRVLVKLFAGVRRAQRVVVDHARANVRVDSGELQRSIDAREPIDNLKEIVGEVVATAGHAAFVEFGTGLRGIGTYPFPLPQQGVPITGSWVYDYKRQQWVGMPAQPYMRPALDSARGEVLEELKG